MYTHAVVRGVQRRGHRPAENALAARQRTASKRRRGDASHLRDTASRASKARATNSTPQHYTTRQIINLPNKQYCAPLPGKKPRNSQTMRGLRAFRARIAGQKSAMHSPRVYISTACGAHARRSRHSAAFGVGGRMPPHNERDKRDVISATRRTTPREPNYPTPLSLLPDIFIPQ